MSRFTSAAGAHFARTRLPEAVAEAGLAAAAAVFTAAIWLSVGAWVLPSEGPVEVAQAAQAGQAREVRHITLPPVVIIGRRDSLEANPVTTTAQNTAAFQVNLR